MTTRYYISAIEKVNDDVVNIDSIDCTESILRQVHPHIYSLEVGQYYGEFKDYDNMIEWCGRNGVDDVFETEVIERTEGITVCENDIEDFIEVSILVHSYKGSFNHRG